MSQLYKQGNGLTPFPPQLPDQFTTNDGIAIPVLNNLNILGSTVAAAGVPFQFTGSGDTVTGQIQYASSSPVSDATLAGVASFDSAAFSVDANGFVSLLGGGAGIESIGVDATSGTGTNPVLPTVGGLITVNGVRVVAGSNPIRTVSTAPNVYQVQVQTSQAVAATDGARNGLAHFDSARFTVDANGFVSANGSGIGETITGDSGGALNPTSGNWNILGRSGSKTSGSGSTLTVNSPPFSQVGASATSSLNTGEFVTGAYTRTLPATAGLLDGDLVIYYCTTASALVITANTGQTIRIGSLVSSSGGTATSTAIGDSVSLRFDATGVSWRAVSVIGTWVMA